MSLPQHIDINKLLDQFNNDPKSLFSAQIEYLVDQGKITKQQMIETLHWETGVDIDGVDDQGVIYGSTMVYGYTYKDYNINFKFDDHLFFELQFELTIQDNKFKFKWITNTLTQEAKKIWSFVSPDIEQSQEKNIRENFPDIIDEALETQEQNKQTNQGEI